MKKYFILAATAAFLVACDTRVNTAPQPDKVIEKNTTIVNPPGASTTEEKKTTTTTETKK